MAIKTVSNTTSKAILDACSDVKLARIVDKLAQVFHKKTKLSVKKRL